MPDYQLTQTDASPNWCVTWTIDRRSHRVSTRTSDRRVFDVSPHTLRHTFGTWAAGGGAHLPNLGGAMGHSNPSTTAKYAKYQPGRFNDVLKASRKKIR